MTQQHPNGVQPSEPSSDYERAMLDVHFMLDELGAPREANGTQLYVRERIKALAAGVLRNSETGKPDLVPIPRDKVMLCTGNEGGYKSFRCLACGASDWEMHFKHRPGCAYTSGPLRNSETGEGGNSDA